MLLSFRVRRLSAFAASADMNQFIFIRPKSPQKRASPSSCKGKFVKKMNYRAVNLSNSSLLFPWGYFPSLWPKSLRKRRPASKELLRAFVLSVRLSQSSLTFRVCRRCEMSNISFHTLCCPSVWLIRRLVELRLMATLSLKCWDMSRTVMILWRRATHPSSTNRSVRHRWRRAEIYESIRWTHHNNKWMAETQHFTSR